MSDLSNFITPNNECVYNSTIAGVHCNATWDTRLCWQTTPAGKIAKQACPPGYGAEADKHVLKTCGYDGYWVEPASFKPGIWATFGDSDYSECLAHHKTLIEHYDVPEVITQATIADIAVPVLDITRMAVLVVALLAMAAACVAMRCVIPPTIQHIKQYTILRHLFAAVIFEAVFLILQSGMDIYKSLSGNEMKNSEKIICKLLIALSNYSNMAACTWLFLQSHHFRFIVTSRQICTLGYVTYCLIGWGIPLIATVVWIVTLSFSHIVTCWAGYSFLLIYLIIEVPKGLLITQALLCFARTTWFLAKDSDRMNKSCCFRRIYHNTIISLINCTYICMSFFTSSALNNFAKSSLATPYVSSVLDDAKGLVLAALFLSLNADIWKYVLNLRRISNNDPVSVIEDSEV